MTAHSTAPSFETCPPGKLTGPPGAIRVVGVVPPPVGAFAERSRAGWDVGWGLGGWSGQGCPGRRGSVGVGDDQPGGGSGDGDSPGVVQPVVEGAQQDQVVRVGGSAVLPMPDVVSVQSAGGP